MSCLKWPCHTSYSGWRHHALPVAREGEGREGGRENKNDSEGEKEEEKEGRCVCERRGVGAAPAPAIPVAGSGIPGSGIARALRATFEMSKLPHTSSIHPSAHDTCTHTDAHAIRKRMYTHAGAHTR